MNRISHRSLGWLLAWPLMQVALDLLIRSRVILTFSMWEWIYYAASLVLSFGFYCGVLWGLRSLHQRGVRWQYASALGLTAFCYIAVLFTSYGVFIANGDLPDLYLLNFIRCETLNALILAKASLHWYEVLLIPLAAAGLGLLLHQLCRQPILQRQLTRMNKLTLAVICYATLWYCWSGTISHGQCFVPLVRTPTICALYAYNECKGINPRPIEMRPRTPLEIRQKIPRPPVNVLVIINESLRRQNLQLFGYARETTPRMSRFAREHPANFFPFPHAYTNSTATLLSVPSILTGISPLQPVAHRCEAPLLWQWAKAAEMQSFFLSSHDLSYCKMNQYFNTPAPDLYGDMGTSGLPYYRDLAIDDHATIEHAVRHLGQLHGSDRPFVGVIHLNTNHYPYNTRADYQHWEGTNMDLYDNTIVEVDAHAGRLIDCLKSNGQLRNTVIIFTSDHGEAFNEHGYIAHFYNHFVETIAVPLWIYIPPALLEARDAGGLRHNLGVPVQNLDILPTILDCIGAWDHPPTSALRQPLLGHSLWQPIREDRTLWITNTDEIMNSIVGLSSITGFQHYLLRTSSKPAKEDCYDLAADPTELNNLWPQYNSQQRRAYRQSFLQFPVAAQIIRDAFPQDEIAPDPDAHQP